MPQLIQYTVFVYGILQLMKYRSKSKLKRLKEQLTNYLTINKQKI